MEIVYFDINDPIEINGSLSACIGYFDGLHRGHQALVNKVKEEAKKNGSRTCLITFFPDPKDVITNTKNKHIQDFDTRLKIIESMGIDVCVIGHFSIELCHTSKDDFFNKVLMNLNLKCLVCGFDFHYADKGSGNYETLMAAAKDKFDVYVIDSVNYHGEKISSTRIRNAIIDGNIELVNNMLGYDYHLRGQVVHGKRYGHILGFPTANLSINDETLILKEGVYIGYTKVNDVYYKSMINIGYNETIASDNPKTIEVHILDFNDDIYDCEILVYFTTKIRDTKKFASLEELKKQLSADVKKAGDLDERQDFIL